MIHRAALIPLVVAMCTASLISAGILQHQNNQADLLADGTVHEQVVDPPPIPTPPAVPPPAAVPAPTVPPVPVPKPPKPLPAKGAPCVTTVRACVKLSSRQAWLLDGAGQVILGPVPITSGKKGHATGTGVTTVLWKDKDHKSEEFDDAPMPYSVFFQAGGIAFHTGSLRAQSSGCIHLANATAIRFFSHLRVGDAVQVLR
jgi:lipoprotein-anchoring transpeptidase ErfK/SrfK